MCWYRMTADQDDALSKNNLGCSYKWGQGARPGSAEAARWCRLAMVQGNREEERRGGLA